MFGRKLFSKSQKSAAAASQREQDVVRLHQDSGDKDNLGLFLNQGRLHFTVVKTNRMGVKQERTMMVNLAAKSLQNFDARGKLKKEFPASSVLGVQKDPEDKCRLLIHFEDYGHPYELKFKNPDDREKFHVLLYVLRDQLTPEHFARANDLEFLRVSVFVGTWNMGDAAPPPDLEPWIPSGKYDIYAIGTQECNYDPRDGASSVEEDWNGQLGRHLGNQYEQVGTMSLWEIRIVVFARREFASRVTNVQTSKLATGVADVLGNKGGVGISFSLYETHLCFVGSHLAARAERRFIRNRNYCDIIDGLQLGSSSFDITNKFHHIFFLGDLNYRIDGITREEELPLINKEQWDALTEFDQLTQERSEGRVLGGFVEGRINFKPTYRYERGSREWSKKKLKNLPSWCDRVLWKSLPGSDMYQIKYGHTDQLLTSDHSPVYSTFFFDIRRPLLSLVLEPSLPDASVKIVCSNFKANLVRSDSNSEKANPFVRIHADFLEQPAFSSAQNRTLSPEWNDDDLPVLVSVISHIPFLKTQHLMLEVLELDVAVGVGWVVLGQGATHLLDIAHNRKCHFHSPLFLHGLECGHIEGDITLLLSEEAQKQLVEMEADAASSSAAPGGGENDGAVKVSEGEDKGEGEGKQGEDKGEGDDAKKD